MVIGYTSSRRIWKEITLPSYSSSPPPPPPPTTYQTTLDGWRSQIPFSIVVADRQNERVVIEYNFQQPQLDIRDMRYATSDGRWDQPTDKKRRGRMRRMTTIFFVEKGRREQRITLHPHIL